MSTDKTEREAFEAHMREIGHGHRLALHPSFPGYRDDTVQTYFCGWLAGRASLSQPLGAAPALGVPASPSEVDQ